MKNFIECKKCGHRSFTRIGVHLKAEGILLFVYLRAPYNPFRLEWFGNTWKQAKDKGLILDFYCKKCKTEYPDTEKIFIFLRQKSILVDLQRK